MHRIYIIFTFASMITTTIRIDKAVKETAQLTEAKKYRGGLSEYIEVLLKADLESKNIKIKK